VATLIRCGICKEEIKKGRWKGLFKHVYLYHNEYYGDVQKWVEATTPSEAESEPTMDRIERALLRTGQFVFPNSESTNSSVHDIVTARYIGGKGVGFERGTGAQQ